MHARADKQNDRDTVSTKKRISNEAEREGAMIQKGLQHLKKPTMTGETKSGTWEDLRHMPVGRVGVGSLSVSAA